MTPAAVDYELDHVYQQLNFTTGIPLAAPDGKIFNLKIIYDTDGITPLLEIIPQ